MDIKRRIGKNVGKFRRAKRLSQEDLSFESGLHRTYVSGVERGVRNPTIEVLEKLALALDVSIADLVSVSDGDDTKDK